MNPAAVKLFFEDLQDSTTSYEFDFNFNDKHQENDKNFLR